MKKTIAFLLFFSPVFAFAYGPYSGNGTTKARDLVCTDCVDGSDLSDTETADANKGLSLGGFSYTVNGGSVTINGNVSLSSMSIVDAYSDSFGAVTAGSTSTVTWTEVTDRLGEFTTSSFTATSAGYYEVIAHSGIAQTAGTGCLLLKKNGTTVAGGEVCNQGVTALASVLDISLTRALNLAANDIVRIDASATTSNATFQKMTFTIKRIP